MYNRVVLNLLKIIFLIIHRIRKDESSKKEFVKEQVKSILLVATTGIGDTLMCTPAVRAVRKAFPDARLSCLVDRRKTELLANNSNLDQVIVYPGKFKKVFSLLKNLRKEKFDLSVILHANDPDIVPLVYLSNAKVRVGWGESEFSFLLTHPVYTKNEHLHFVLHKKKILESIGIRMESYKTELNLSREHLGFADNFLKKNRIKKDDFLIGFHPFGSKVSRWWPESHCTQFINLLFSNNKCRAKIFLFGGTKEAKFARKINEECGNRLTVLSGDTSLSQSASLIKKCDVFVTTDSGPMHIAFALDVPTIALFGPEMKNAVFPLDEKTKAIAIEKEVPCIRPCKTKECDQSEHFCMELIKPEEVLHEVEKMCDDRYENRIY